MTWSPHYADCSWKLPQRSLCIVAHLSIKHAFIYIFKLTCTQSLCIKMHVLESLFCLQAESESTKPLQWHTIDDTCSQSLLWYNNDIKTVNNNQLVSEAQCYISFSFASYCNKKQNSVCFTSQFITNNIWYAHCHFQTYAVFAKHTFADFNSRHSWFSQC